MIAHLLVPLDGSKLAEAALPPAISLAVALRASVTLMHVIEHHAPETIHGDRHLTNQDDACRYLGEQAERFPPVISVECHVHEEEVRDVARSIVAHAREMKTDLIIMCAHGAGGWGGMVVGTIAQQVIGIGQTPLLLIQIPEKGNPAEPGLKSLLVALDSNPEHESGLELAAELALTSGAKLNLVHIVPTMSTLKGKQAAAGRLLPATASAMLDMTEHVALEYLEVKAIPLRNRGLTVNTMVFRGDLAEEVAKAGVKSSSDLIVIGTHGKAGLDAFWQGSAASKIIGKTKLPLLLVPVLKG